jgi:hypothetical protein
MMRSDKVIVIYSIIISLFIIKMYISIMNYLFFLYLRPMLPLSLSKQSHLFLILLFILRCVCNCHLLTFTLILLSSPLYQFLMIVFLIYHLILHLTHRLILEVSSFLMLVNLYFITFLLFLLCSFIIFILATAISMSFLALTEFILILIIS